MIILSLCQNSPLESEGFHYISSFCRQDEKKTDFVFNVWSDLKIHIDLHRRRVVCTMSEWRRARRSPVRPDLVCAKLFFCNPAILHTKPRKIVTFLCVNATFEADGDDRFFNSCVFTNINYNVCAALSSHGDIFIFSNFFYFFFICVPSSLPLLLLFHYYYYSLSFRCRRRRRRISIFIKISVAYEIDRIVFFQIASHSASAYTKNTKNMCQMYTHTFSGFVRRERKFGTQMVTFGRSRRHYDPFPSYSSSSSPSDFHVLFTVHNWMYEFIKLGACIQVISATINALRAFTLT